MSAGYSGTPPAKKLGLAKGQVAWLVDAPPDHPATWGPLPEGFAFAARPGRGRKATSPADVVVWFVTARAVLEAGLPGAVEALAPDGMIWIAWPKKTPAKGVARIASDVTEDVVRAVALPLGLVDVKVCAIDGAWSGLKLVIRKALRPT